MKQKEYNNHIFYFLMSKSHDLDDGIDKIFIGRSTGENLVNPDIVFKFFNKEENINKVCIIEGDAYFYFNFYSEKEAERFSKKNDNEIKKAIKLYKIERLYD